MKLASLLKDTALQDAQAGDEHQDGKLLVAPIAADAAGQLQAVHLGHVEVEDGHVGSVGAEQVPGGASILAGQHRVASLLQYLGHQVAESLG